MDDQSALHDQEMLVKALQRLLAKQAPVPALFETHISWVLAGRTHAYKIKKAVRFDFLDFSTLEARHFYCQEEVRLNRRLASALYLGVLPVTGSLAQPQLGGAGAALEYCVWMRSFAQDALWSTRIARGALAAGEVDQLARKLALFHQQAARAPAASPWGSAAAIEKIANDNIALLAALGRSAAHAGAVETMRAWQAGRQRALGAMFAQRKEQGFVRECHGDLHSGNILTIDGAVEVFDCIEFSDSLRWIDVMADLAFIRMDLRRQGCMALAARLLNGYLEASGDYEGVPVLRYYETECALVRWKIALLRAGQGESSQQAEQLMAFAQADASPGQGALIALHGFAGSGKSTLARQLVELLGAVQIRSDVERKRMHALAGAAPAAAPPGQGIYDAQSSAATYARLRTLAAAVAGAGVPVLADATFLARSQRRLFETLAAELGVPFLLLDVHAREPTLRARIETRARQGGDASDAGLAVLEHQLAQHEALDAHEAAHALRIDSEAALEPEALRRACLARLEAVRKRPQQK